MTNWSASEQEPMTDRNQSLSQTEREMLGLGKTVTYSYRCLHCRHEDEVEDIVVDGFAAMSGLKPGRMPRLVCPACGGSFRALRNREQRER